MFIHTLLLVTIASGLSHAAVTVDSTAYFGGMRNAFEKAGLTSFDLALQNATGIDNSIFFSNDTMYTIFAPTNHAIELAGGAIVLNSTVPYHVVPAKLSANNISTTGHTIASTLYKFVPPSFDTTAADAEYQGLMPDNGTQVLVLQRNGADKISVLGANYTASGVTKDITTYQNLVIVPVDMVLAPPLDANSTLYVANNLTDTAGVLAHAIAYDKAFNLSDALATEEGFTFFSAIKLDDPVWELVANASTSLANFPNLTAIVANHIIDGSVIYSPMMTDGQQFMTLPGSTIKFSSNSSGSFITGNTTAKIVRADVPVQNGVIHFIDRMMYDTFTNFTAADIAAQADATASATTASVVIGQATAGSVPTSGASELDVFHGLTLVAAMGTLMAMFI